MKQATVTYLFLGCLAMMLFSSCQRLDDQFFNPTFIKEGNYLLDAYTGETDFPLDTNYKIKNILQLVLPSRTKYETADKYIQGVYLGNYGRIDKDTVILYLHGNKGNIDFYWNRAKLLANVGGNSRYGVLIFDYRGFGRSNGVTNEASLYADMEGALLWLKSRGMQGSRLIVYGFSMGSAPAVEACFRSRILTPSKLILEAPIASAYALIENSSKLNMPASYFTDLQLNNAKKIKRVMQPMLWLHGEQDDFVSLENQGQLVYDNYKGEYKEKTIVAAAGHSNIPNTMGLEGYKKTILEFITRRR
jgi:fermentation-respiration switch protein FrsA (DUF1100 family)